MLFELSDAKLPTTTPSPEELQRALAELTRYAEQDPVLREYWDLLDVVEKTRGPAYTPSISFTYTISTAA